MEKITKTHVCDRCGSECQKEGFSDFHITNMLEVSLRKSLWVKIINGATGEPTDLCYMCARLILEQAVRQTK
jgi:hypothetical protein